jgi:hypothetical protein
MDTRYIEFFDGYRAAYGLADFEHPEAYVDPDSGKKKPVYRWNFEELLAFNPVMKTKKQSLES